MTPIRPPARKPAVVYPDSDGEPMADNTVQFDWIAVLKWNAEAYFRDWPDVFVAGDHLIYPVEGDADIKQAPDVFVAFGRPKGDRGSYKVWEEGGVFPQVVFEVWSPGNRFEKMQEKFEFYERYGALEYYLLYPEFPSHAAGWRRDAGKLVLIPDLNGYVSPRLGWRFAVGKGSVRVYGPDGRELRTPTEIFRARDEAEREAAEQKARADEQEARADRLAARLRALGVDPDAV